MEDCRVCLETDTIENLIAPCRCKGTQKYIHRHCLDSWREAGDIRHYSKCNECRYDYKFTNSESLPNSIAHGAEVTLHILMYIVTTIAIVVLIVTEFHIIDHLFNKIFSNMFGNGWSTYLLAGLCIFGISSAFANVKALSSFFFTIAMLVTMGRASFSQAIIFMTGMGCVFGAASMWKDCKVVYRTILSKRAKHVDTVLDLKDLADIS